MNKFLVILVIAVAIFGLYWTSRDDKPKPTSNSVDAVSDARPNPENATFTIDDEPITFKNGTAARELGESGLTEEFEIGDFVTYGDINNDGKNDTALIFVQHGGVSGLFVYVASYVSGPTKYTGSNAVFIGDRIAPQSLKISNGTIVLEYLDRNADEPLAAEPTVKKTKNFVYRSGKLQAR